MTGSITRDRDPVAAVDFWEQLRGEQFATERLNLNPGTLGTPAASVHAAMRSFRDEDEEAWPLGRYVRGREALRRARAAATALWGHEPALAGGATQTMNFVSLALGRGPRTGPLTVLTTAHEHHGAVAVFERDPVFRVAYLSPEELTEEQAFADRVGLEHPDVCLFSQRTWTDGTRLPVERWCAVLAARAPDCLRIVDAAQALGVEPLVIDAADVVIASGHKWLGGPAGTGFAWASDRAIETIGPLWRTGEPLDPDARLAAWEPAGGQDFALYAGVEAALELYARVGPQRARSRGELLAGGLARALAAALPEADVDATGPVVRARFRARDPYPVYAALNARGIHTKCVKVELASGEQMALLRIGVPWYESPARLAGLVTAVERLRG